MSAKLDTGRRRALRLMIGGLAAVPLVRLADAVAAEGGKLPHLAEDDPQAQALSYVHDASQARYREEKGGVPGDDQFCYNCQFALETEGEWLPCQIFPGKTVARDGWCTAWSPRA